MSSAISSIVSIINDNLIATAFKDKRFQKPALFSISKSIPYPVGDNYESIPTEIDERGNGKKLVPDDRDPVRIYHKLLNLASSQDPSQYGNGNGNIVRTYQMSAIVFAQSNLIKMSDHALEEHIMANSVDRLTKAQLASVQMNACFIKQNGTDFNSKAIWEREYNAKKYYLNTNHLFFEMKYTIECRLKKSCINTCTTC